MHDGCCGFDWPYGKDKTGRGRVTLNNKRMFAAQAACTLAHGPAPIGKPMALHKCGMGHLNCINANCLYWGDEVDNAKDAMRHGTAFIPNPKGERHGMAKLSDVQVMRIRSLHSTGKYTLRSLAKMFNIGFSHVHRLVNNLQRSVNEH